METAVDGIMTNINIDEFVKFHKLLIEAAPSGYTPCYFRCAMGGKDPYTPVGSWIEAQLTPDGAISWLKQGGNIGIAGLNDDPLVIIDIDDETITNYTTLAPTLTTRSGSRTGVHLFYFEDIIGSIPNIPTLNAGEIRAKNQYVIAAGSFVSGYEEHKEDIGKYTIEVAIAPTEITFSGIPQVFADHLAMNKKNTQLINERKAKKTGEHKSTFFDLSVYDIIGSTPKPQNRFPSIFHASKTGENTSISNQGLIQCWRHMVSLNAQQALCVLSGFLSCQEAGTPHSSGMAGPSLYTDNDEALFHAWEYAKRNKYIPEDDPIPSRVMCFIAISQNFCKETDIKDGWKMPKDAYKKTNNYLEREGLKSWPIVSTPLVVEDVKTTVIKDTAEKTHGDLFYLDEKSRRLINYETLLNSLLEKYTFKTLSDTEQVLVYQKGVYTDASVVIKGFVESALGGDATSYIVREEIGHVQRRFYTDRELFNADKDYIPLKNGLLNLTTFKLEPFNPDRMYMFKLPGKFDESAPYEAIERFFQEVLHEEDIPILQEFFGYCLIADLPAHKMMWLIGDGRNGKSTTGNLLKALIGEQNTSAVQLNELDGEHRFSYVEMFGKLLNLVPEPPTRFGLQTPLIKAATGGDTIRGEIKGVQKPINFKNFAKFLVYANEIPRIFDTSLAFWNRTIAVHYPNQFIEEHEMKDVYKEILKLDGLAGLLNWAIIGLKRLQANNYEFTHSKWQDETKMKMERSSQPIETFLKECCTIEDENAWILKDDLYLAFQEFCSVFKIRTYGNDTFAKVMRRIAPITAGKKKVEGTRIPIWTGIKMKEKPETICDFKENNNNNVQGVSPVHPVVHGKNNKENIGLKDKRSNNTHIINTRGGMMDRRDRPDISINQNPQQAQCELCGKTTLLIEIKNGDLPLMACKECEQSLKENDGGIKNKKCFTCINSKKNNDMSLTGMDHRANDETFQIEQSKSAKKNMEEKTPIMLNKGVSVIDILHSIEVDFGSDMPLVEIMTKAEEAGITHDKAEEAIELMKRDGVLFSPVGGVVKFIR